MSALPPKADMVQRGRDVRFVPKADIETNLIVMIFEQSVPPAQCDPTSQGTLKVVRRQ